MAKKQDSKQKNDVSRREALQRLAQLSIYSAPAVVTLLSAERSYAQSSEAQMNLNNGQITNICSQLSNLPGTLGNNETGGFFGGNDPSDCG